jgi:hypothetical protein
MLRGRAVGYPHTHTHYCHIPDPSLIANCCFGSTMKNRSVILTTHSMEECQALCHRIGIMVRQLFCDQKFVCICKRSFSGESKLCTFSPTHEWTHYFSTFSQEPMTALPICSQLRNQCLNLNLVLSSHHCHYATTIIAVTVTTAVITVTCHQPLSPRSPRRHKNIRGSICVRVCSCMCVCLCTCLWNMHVKCSCGRRCACFPVCVPKCT